MAPDLDRRLSPEDYAFLLMDTSTEPMNIGSVAVFDGDVPYDEFVGNVESKLHLIPRYTQVVIPAPYNVGRPTWESDPHFELSRHIHEVHLKAPGDERQLLDFAAQAFSRQMDRSKPLWEAYLVKGLAGGHTALVTIISHCLVDGVGGVELAMVMLDTTPNPTRVTYSRPVERPVLPSRRRLLVDAIFDDLSEWWDRWSLWQRRLGDLLPSTRGGQSWTHGVRRALEVAIPTFAIPVEQAVFNKKLSGRRVMATARFSLPEFRAIKANVGGTINDVALAIVGAAVGRYMREHGERTNRRRLRVLAPVNVRTRDQSGRMGNRITFLLVEVPLDEMSPQDRLAAISRRMSWLKAEHAGEGLEVLGEELLSLPTPVLKALTLFGFPRNTVANMVVTNVPGPVMPLYTVGHRLMSHYAMAPISWEMGLGCAITSYDTEIAFSLVADPDAVPDIDRVRELVVEAHDEIREAAGIRRHAMIAEVEELTVTATTVTIRG
jgi:WS/DGAT/MGAT family acyltransferase